MLEGLMQDDFPLTTQHILRRIKTVNHAAEVVTMREPGRVTRATMGEMATRIDKLAGALQRYGIKDGDRVATFCWNNQEHLEMYYAIPCLGAVLHTLNIRLFPEQLVYIANHAKDRIVFVDDSLVPLLEKVADQFETVEQFVVVGDGDTGSLSPVVRYEEFIDGDAIDEYPDVPEKAAAAMCYTSGTTGNPKGVLYSHRSAVLHSMCAALTDTMGVSGDDRVIPIVPMFHANAWGLPYACGLIGASLILPERFLQAEPLAWLIESEKPTFAGAVPTIWMDMLRYADENGTDLSSIKVVPCGGAAVPRSLMEAFEERHGVEILHAWGMTETSPIGSVARAPAGVTGEERWKIKTSQGKVAPLVEMRIMDDDGNEVPWDGTSTGEIEVRGPWIAAAYYEDPEGTAEKFRDGWLRTGDIASIDADGYMRISDRAKDVIKSGGEWISSVDLENELMAHPALAEAAVIAAPDERWTERPLACVVVKEGAEAPSVDDLRAHLGDRVAKWWIPENYAFIDEVPKTSVGKFDKKVLRARLADGELETVGAATAA